MGEDMLNEDVYGRCKFRTGRLRGPIARGIKLEARLVIPEVTRAHLRVESDGQLGQQGGRRDAES
jgi:hypothetical protein